MKLLSDWEEFMDLTVFEGSILLIGVDPKRGEFDDEYANYCYERGWYEEASAKCAPLMSAVRSRSIEITSECRMENGEFDPRRTHLLKSSFAKWCNEHGYESVAEALNKVPRGDMPNAEHHVASVISGPSLKQGRNSRESVENWVAWQAKEMAKDFDKMADLAAGIRLLAEKYGFESERGKMTDGNIIKMIPKGLTGGRAKGNGRSQNRPHMTFGNEKSKAKVVN